MFWRGLLYIRDSDGDWGLFTVDVHREVLFCYLNVTAMSPRPLNCDSFVDLDLVKDIHVTLRGIQLPERVLNDSKII